MSPLDDPQVRAAAHDLQATLGRMGDKLEAMVAEQQRPYAPRLDFRVSPDMAQQIHAYMRRHRIFNQAEALRRIMAAGLKAVA